MLALSTYLLGSLVFKRGYIISYKRGLLFYYLLRGRSRAIQLNNKQRSPRFFYVCS